MKTLLIAPEESGGIRTYTEVLQSALGADTRSLFHLPPPAEINSFTEPLIHMQHEFGLFGSKLPGRYLFPSWFKRARAKAPSKRWIATAHTVLSPDWKYSVRTRRIVHSLLNTFVVPFARKSWSQETWEKFDGVIVHSAHQVPTIQAAGCSRVAVIPHFIPNAIKAEATHGSELRVVLFGYFSREKGQDLAIEAWARLKNPPQLQLAGGVRRPEDHSYLVYCEELIRKLGLADKVEITGFIAPEKVAEVYAGAALVLAPFRETSGSGTLATAIAHRAAILASDLPINTEINERVPGTLETFTSGSPESLAEKVQSLLSEPTKLGTMRDNANLYAEKHSVEKMATLHRKFYADILGGGL